MAKLKASLPVFLVAVSLQMVSAQGEEVASISTVDDCTLVGYPNPSPVAVPASNLSGGYLEEAEIAISTI